MYSDNGTMQTQAWREHLNYVRSFLGTFLMGATTASKIYQVELMLSFFKIKDILPSTYLENIYNIGVGFKKTLFFLCLV